MGMELTPFKAAVLEKIKVLKAEDLQRLLPTTHLVVTFKREATEGALQLLILVMREQLRIGDADRSTLLRGIRDYRWGYGRVVSVEITDKFNVDDFVWYLGRHVERIASVGEEKGERNEDGR